MNEGDETPGAQEEPGLQADQRVLDRAWLRIGAGLAVAGQAMVFSLAVNITEAEGWSYWVVHGILIFAALASLAVLGGDLVRSAFEALRERRVSIDLLFLLTLLGALAGSLVSTFTQTGSVYYEVVAILIVVHTVGKMLGARSRVSALRAVSRTRQTFDVCRVIEPDGTQVVRRASEVGEGVLVRIDPGAPLSVDGEIVSGRGYVQETAMTGEWRPVVRGPGEPVLAGTYSLDGTFDVRVGGGPRKLDAIFAEVERARLAPSALQEQSDRLMRWFLPMVAGVSVLTFGAWLYLASWDRALFNAMAVLLVACPCAMGLATPVAVWGGLARFSQLGLVARTGDFLDRLARCTVVCLDKTGTLSSDALAIQRWEHLDTRLDEPALRNIVSQAEAGLFHPVASALSETECPEPGRWKLVERTLVPGLGVVALVAESTGRRWEVRVGEEEVAGYVAPGSVAARAEARRPGAQGVQESGPSGAGSSVAVEAPAAGKRVHVYLDGSPAARIDLAETWRSGLHETIDAFRGLGLRVQVLSGDPAAGEVLETLLRGASADVAVFAGMTPAEKRDHILGLQRSGEVVALAGDGINDAAALSAADASIAVKSGTDLARASAQAVLVGDDLRALPEALAVARRVRSDIRHNLLFAGAYNIVGMMLAAAGMLHPIAAALLMLGSSFFVSVRALRSSSGGRVHVA